MKNKNIVIVLFIILLAVIGYIAYQTFIEKEETLEEKLENASFVLSENYYVRDVEQEDGVYEEVISPEDNTFVRMTGDDSEQEVYSYNYEKDTFTYLYYFEGELVIKLIYDYKTESIIEDESDLYESLSSDIETLKEYFNDLKEEYKLETEEM